MAILHSPLHPLYIATSPATAKRSSFATRSWTGRFLFPVLLSLPPSKDVPNAITFAGVELFRATSSPKEYVYPDPVPPFAESETRKFKTDLKRKLREESETFGDDLDAVVDVCSQIFSKFLHDEYGGPGTLLVEPFTDMMLAIKDESLPGAAIAARAALLWAQSYVDQDWESWHATNHRQTSL